MSNEDIGFVRPGQPVKLKFAAFTPSRSTVWGMANRRTRERRCSKRGRSPRQRPARRRGQRPLRYKALVTLDASALETDGVKYPLSVGMQSTAEIRATAQWRSICSPVKKAWHEAGRDDEGMRHRRRR